MLNFFKSNNLAVTFVNLALILIYRLPLLFRPLDFRYLYRHNEPAARLFFGPFINGGGPAAYWLLAAGGLLCFVESLMINAIVQKHKLSTKKNYLSGLIFVVFASLSPDCLAIGPAMISTFFLLICLDKIFGLSRQEKLYTDIFDLGFYSVMAVAFYFPSLYFLALVYTGYFIVRPVIPRELLIIITGFATVMIVMVSVYYGSDITGRLLSDLMNLNNRLPLTSILKGKIYYLPLAWSFVVSLILLFRLPRTLNATVIQTRKYISVLVVNAAFAFAALLLAFNFNLSHLLFWAVSAGIVAAVLFVETKTNILNEFLFIVLILSVPVIEYLPLIL